jgi:hypothetical protein
MSLKMDTGGSASVPKSLESINVPSGQDGSQDLNVFFSAHGLFNGVFLD